MNYRALKTKLFWERILMFPFVFSGRVAGKIFGLNTKHKVFLFFPNGDIGGSPQVNIDLLNCVKDENPLVIFSKTPRNNQFRPLYDLPGVRVIDLHKYIDRKPLHFVNFFFRGVLASWINASGNSIVAGGESLFFYKVIPHLRSSVHCVEICHLDAWMNYSIGFIKHINARIFSTLHLKEKVAAQYRRNNIPKTFETRLHFVDSGVVIPEISVTNNKDLQVFFIGRGAPQKRVYLATAIAQRAVKEKIPATFHFVGDVENVIDVKQFPAAVFYGNVSDQAEMQSLYQKADVLLLTSAFEGLPIVVMQMMAHGKAVVSTAVNGIPDYIRHMENGLLIFSTDEEQIVHDGVDYIRRLAAEPALLKKLGQRSREIAIEKFSMAVFCERYRRLLKFS